MKFDVIIPARDEAASIANVLCAFLPVQERIGDLFVIVDDATADDTEERARLAVEATPWRVIRKPAVRGKGQCVSFAMERVTSALTMFCDADWRGLSTEHITQLADAADGRTMVLGVPEYPRDVPLHVTNAWQWVTGMRMVPTWAVNEMQFHGYLMEHQINQQARKCGLDVKAELLHGARSPFEYPLPLWRYFEGESDRQWGIDNGVFIADPTVRG